MDLDRLLNSALGQGYVMCAEAFTLALEQKARQTPNPDPRVVALWELLQIAQRATCTDLPQGFKDFRTLAGLTASREAVRIRAELRQTRGWNAEQAEAAAEAAHQTQVDCELELAGMYAPRLQNASELRGDLFDRLATVTGQAGSARDDDVIVSLILATLSSNQTVRESLVDKIPASPRRLKGEDFKNQEIQRLLAELRQAKTAHKAQLARLEKAYPQLLRSIELDLIKL